MLIASLVIAVTASVGSDPNFYQPQNWKGPTMSEMETCAHMARDLNAGFEYLVSQGLNTDWQTKYASCELVAIDDDSAEGAEHAADTVSAKPVSHTF